MKSRAVDLGLGYQEALHGVQTGIAYNMERDPTGLTAPKHLRVGVDSCQISLAAITELLMQKGIITQEELDESLRLWANNEVNMWEKRLSGELGTKITCR